ncbi:hypothetical protein [Facilibium subflavum]|uniref:hypothetical protein n=1 Tax=Facilibium subflavum TaxID=2219058 RepID=UPI000E652E38|nr:hypothetical protein [Facilibium subflavum]
MKKILYALAIGAALASTSAYAGTASTWVRFNTTLTNYSNSGLINHKPATLDRVKINLGGDNYVKAGPLAPGWQSGNNIKLPLKVSNTKTVTTNLTITVSAVSKTSQSATSIYHITCNSTPNGKAGEYNVNCTSKENAFTQKVDFFIQGGVYPLQMKFYGINSN